MPHDTPNLPSCAGNQLLDITLVRCGSEDGVVWGEFHQELIVLDHGDICTVGLHTQTGNLLYLHPAPVFVECNCVEQGCFCFASC